MAKDDAREVKIPLALIGLGILLLGVVVWRTPVSGRTSVGDVVTLVAVATAAQVVLMLIGALITSKLIGASFGAMGPAVLKLIAIAIFPDALGAAVNIQGISWVISVALYFILLVYLFDLDTKEALIFTGVMLLIRIAVAFFFAMTVR